MVSCGISAPGSENDNLPFDDPMAAGKDAAQGLQHQGDENDEELQRALRISLGEQAITFLLSQPGVAGELSQVGKIGLVNGGNTCWFNASIQALFGIPALRNLIIYLNSDLLHLAEAQCDAYAQLLQELRLLFAALSRTPATVKDQYAVDPTETIAALRNACNASTTAADSFISENRQQDASEFVHRLIGILDSVFCLQAQVTADNDGPRCGSKLQSLFFGESVRRHGKDLSNASNDQRDQFSQLLVPIKGTKHILEGLENLLFFGGMDVDGGIDDTETWFTSLPTILCFTLKRFDYNPQSQSIEKLLNTVRFERKLNLTPYCVASDGVQLAYRTAHEAIANRVRETKEMLRERSKLKAKLASYETCFAGNMAQNQDLSVCAQRVVSCMAQIVSARNDENENTNEVERRVVIDYLQRLVQDLRCEFDSYRARLLEIDASLARLRPSTEFDTDVECCECAVSYTYYLHAVIVHDGPSVNGGHYRAYVADDARSTEPDACWTEFNDSHITRVSYAVVDALQREPGSSTYNSTAYSLVYVRADADWPQNIAVPIELQNELLKSGKYAMKNMSHKWAERGWKPNAVGDEQAGLKGVKRVPSHDEVPEQNSVPMDCERERSSLRAALDTNVASSSIVGSAADWCRLFDERFFEPTNSWGRKIGRTDDSMAVLQKLATQVTDGSSIDAWLLSCILRANNSPPIDFVHVEPLTDTILTAARRKSLDTPQTLIDEAYRKSVVQMALIADEWNDAMSQGDNELCERLFGVCWPTLMKSFKSLLNSDCLALHTLMQTGCSRLRRRVRVRALVDVRLLHTTMIYLCAVRHPNVDCTPAEDGVLRSLFCEHFLTTDCAAFVRNAELKIGETEQQRVTTVLRSCVDQVENELQLLFARDHESNRVRFARTHHMFACLRLAARAFYEALKLDSSVGYENRALMHAQLCYVLQAELRNVDPRCCIQPIELVTYMRYFIILRWNSQIRDTVLQIGTRQYGAVSDDWGDDVAPASDGLSSSDRSKLQSIADWIKHAICEYVRTFSKSQYPDECCIAEIIVRNWVSLLESGSLLNRTTAEVVNAIVQDLIVAQTEPNGKLDDVHLLDWIVRNTGYNSSLYDSRIPTTTPADDLYESVETLHNLIKSAIAE